jgi:shikimate kinase
MATGKSTLGRLCAARLGYAFRDSDAVIEAAVGSSIPSFFAEQGEAAFRQKEREVIAELAAKSGQVIATGGGVVLDAANVTNLRATGRVLLLVASPETILQRVGDAQSRPLLATAPDPLAHIESLLAERFPHYARAAHHQIEIADRAPYALVDEIVRWFRNSF